MKRTIKWVSICFTFVLSIHLVSGQTEMMVDNVKEFTNIGDALKSPEKVLRLNLSNNVISFLPDSIWNKFKNLEYLSLKNDHLQEIPAGIGYLQELKILDLSGNDFTELPSSFSKLSSLREIYLNDEKYMNMDKSIKIIKDLPNLKIVHLENDNLKTLPKSIMYLNNVETLYLNNNKLTQFPLELNQLKHLKYVDVKGNLLNLQGVDTQSFGYKIIF